MRDSVADLLARVAAIGARLRAIGGAVEYEGPCDPSILTAELRDAIRTQKAALLERLRPQRIGTLLARLADLGIWLSVAADGIRVNLHPGATPELLEDDLIDELGAREAEVRAWLQTPVEDQPREELLALGYDLRPEDPDAKPWVVLSDPPAPPEPRQTRPMRRPQLDLHLGGDMREDRIRERALAIIPAAPHAGLAVFEVAQLLHSREEAVAAEFDALVGERVIERRGKGTPGEPHRYRRVPSEHTEEKP
jgi:hypothetical protein